MLAVLLDPDKCTGALLENVLSQFHRALPDFIFIGGSSKSCRTDELVEALQNIPIPKILFPGDASQFTEGADAILFLSLISGRNPDYLIGQHVKSAQIIKKSTVEVIPTAYLLIDGATRSSVQRVSDTNPIHSDNIDLCISTAVAGELLGMKMVYLEAGSGAKNPVPTTMISAVKQSLDIPLIVGGGINSVEKLQQAYEAGADMVVVGNLFESQPEKIADFVRMRS